MRRVYDIIVFRLSSHKSLVTAYFAIQLCLKIALVVKIVNGLGNM
jgi:hypothetical protein